jgi:hypothetical protein
VRAHEARPNAPHGVEAAFGDAIDAAEGWIAQTSAPFSTTK